MFVDSIETGFTLNIILEKANYSLRELIED